MKARVLVLALLMAAAATAQLSQAFPMSVGARWWKNPLTARQLELTPEQQTKMDEIFQQNRVKLIDLNASVDREEAIMEELMSADPLDATKIRAEIDRLAQARADLEKVNANMLLGMRLLLTKEQWVKLQDRGMPGRGGRGVLIVPKKAR